MEVILECALLAQKATAHPHLKERFSFPDWYGNNLDALYDCLTELSDCRILLQEPAALFAAPYGEAVLDTLRDAARSNPGLELVTGNATEA